MKKLKNAFIKGLNYLCLTGVVALGFITIVATGGGGGGSNHDENNTGDGRTVWIDIISQPSSVSAGDTLTITWEVTDSEGAYIDSAGILWDTVSHSQFDPYMFQSSAYSGPSGSTFTTTITAPGQGDTIYFRGFADAGGARWISNDEHTIDISNQPTYDYTTTKKEVASEYMSVGSGGTVKVRDSNSALHETALSVPGGSLSFGRTISISEVTNPPALPDGLSFVSVLDLSPDNTSFSEPATLTFTYTDSQLSDAGLYGDTFLKLYYYDGSTWIETTIDYIDTVDNKVSAPITHFTFYALTGLNCIPPSDLGTPRKGDLVYRLGFIFDNLGAGWRPGHVGIYTGEQDYHGAGLAKPEVVEHGKYNVIEALPLGVTYSYYNFPNVTETHSGLPRYHKNESRYYMGAREPRDFTLTNAQRDAIVDYAKEQIGKPYAWGQTLGEIVGVAYVNPLAFGMLSGWMVKGQYGSFNCVGLAEKAYEQAGINNGEGLVSSIEENSGVGLTPAEQYNKTRPAGGSIPAPTIEWATITPNHGNADTPVFVQAFVSHTDGLSAIAGVTYETDNGYTNPTIYINDEEIDGDKTAGDGIYSSNGHAGAGNGGRSFYIILTVTDIYGNVDYSEPIWFYRDS